MRITITLTCALLLMKSLTAAQLPPEILPQESHQSKFHNCMLTSDEEIPTVMHQISQLLASGVDPKKIACIFDVDGTLTDESDPTFAGESAYPRSSAMISFVRSLHASGVTMIASSAWDMFEHTISRIKRLGLLDVFLTPDSTLSTKTVTIRDRTFTVHSLGNIISVRDTANVSKYYRAKFLSTIFAGNEIAPKTIFPYHQIFFFDDSERNLMIFQSDFEWYFLKQDKPSAFSYLLAPPKRNITSRQIAALGA